MELDFDKEINALLRQAARSGEFVSTNEQNHLDADEISAFAENALPEKARNVYIKHFADCDRCRTILTNTILLNAEAETEAASSAAAIAAPDAPQIVENNIPWYRKMFLMPNLAYTMGALVLVFGGAFGFLVLQNISQNSGSEVSQIQNSETRASGPSAGDSAATAYNSNSAASSTANTSANAMSNSALSTAAEANKATTNTFSAAVQSSPNAAVAADETSTADVMTESKAQNQELAKQSKEDFQLDGVDSKAARKAEVKPADKNKKDDEISVSDQLTKTMPSAAAPPPPAAPMEAQPSITQRRAENVPKSDAAPKKRADSRLSENESARRVGGKTFNRVGGVWVDSAYSKSDSSNMILPATKTIRRGSNEYQKLDRQVRVIAESLDGAVIIVWKNGAYRIQ